MPRRRDAVPTAIDLFAGCGGLTVGIKNAGFRVVGAVEIEQGAYATYKSNHPEVAAFKQDIRAVRGSSLLEAAGIPSLDLLAGCPPCQGFSSLTSKWRRSDSRNALVREMQRLIGELRPKALMMENVPGLALKGRPLFTPLLKDLDRLGYVVNWDVLQVADYGVPQRRRRLVLLAGLGFPISLPKPTHSRDGRAGLPRWRTVGDVLGGLPKPITLAEARAQGGARLASWHVVRNISDLNQRRLRYAQSGKGWMRIPKRLRPACHQDKSAGFRNAYGRMSWDEPSGTITGGCTTPSKGRFGHPREERTISVREAAILQTFPATYRFECDHIDRVCEMIGNALPCDFAKVLAVACGRALAT
jgi:DNA (cytosine-5)-methyltransferase 1